MQILIFEDESPAAERLQKLLGDIDESLQIIEILDNVADAIEMLGSGVEVDLIVSDVELADGLCFGIFNEVKTDIPVIFTTAYNQYAIRAFEANAIDYLLKPVKIEDLKQALQRARRRLPGAKSDIDYQALAQSILEKRDTSTRRFTVRYGNKMKVVKPSDAAYFYSVQKSTFMVDRTGKSLPLDESLSQVESDLGESFFRINRNLIVHIDAIESVDMLGKGRMKINLEHPPEDLQFLNVSSDRSPQFRKWYQGR